MWATCDLDALLPFGARCYEGRRKARQRTREIFAGLRLECMHSVVESENGAVAAIFVTFPLKAFFKHPWDLHLLATELASIGAEIAFVPETPRSRLVVAWASSTWSHRRNETGENHFRTIVGGREHRYMYTEEKPRHPKALWRLANHYWFKLRFDAIFKDAWRHTFRRAAFGRRILEGRVKWLSLRVLGGSLKTLPVEVITKIGSYAWSLPEDSALWALAALS